jgi:6-pyruvoyltetrahydropterin/6-carboxytetrahydropterin synthase
MYEVKVRDTFSAAHQLRVHRGKCERLHGHNWTVEITIVSSTLNAGGMVVDFTVVQKALSRVISSLDHSFINRLPYFKKKNPTAEMLARYIFISLEESLPKRRTYSVKNVVIGEMNNTWAVYSE